MLSKKRVLPLPGPPSTRTEEPLGIPCLNKESNPDTVADSIKKVLRKNKDQKEGQETFVVKTLQEFLMPSTRFCEPCPPSFQQSNCVRPSL